MSELKIRKGSRIEPGTKKISHVIPDQGFIDVIKVLVDLLFMKEGKPLSGVAEEYQGFPPLVPEPYVKRKGQCGLR